MLRHIVNVEPKGAQSTKVVEAICSRLVKKKQKQIDERLSPKTQSPLCSAEKQSLYFVSVKSRSLLSTFEDEQPHFLGLGGEYPDQWEDTPAVVMAAWRHSEQQKLGVEPSRAETHPPYRSKSNDTQAPKNLLLDLHR